MGKLLIIAGIILIVLGLVIHYTGSLPIGKLPGDIVIERKNCFISSTDSEDEPKR